MTITAPTDQLRAEVALPGSDSWDKWADYELHGWTREFDLTQRQHKDMYGPYDGRSVFIGIQNEEQPVGVSRMLLPKHNARRIADAGFLVIHAALEGTPHWGKLDISAEGWRLLEEFDGRVAVDLPTHIVPERNGASDPRVLLLLNSMQLGVSLSLEKLRKAEVRSNGQSSEPVTVTGLVRKYRTRMMTSFNYTQPKNPNRHIIGVQPIGEEVPYGEQDVNKYTTAVIIPTRSLIAADIAIKSLGGRDRRLVHPEQFDSDAFNNSAFMQGYKEGNYEQ